MKTKTFFLVVLATIGVAGATWLYSHHQPVQTDATARKVLYYTCAMHPWVRENQPGPCPVCGMNLTPVYANANDATTETNAVSGMVTLEPDSISTINVRTDLVERRAVRRTLHLSGEIAGNSATTAWFEFTGYERDLPWLKAGQTFNVSVSSAPDKIYHAQIKAVGAKPFADTNFDMMSGSTTVRAEILNPPVEAGNFGKNILFNGLHAEAHVVGETEAVLVVPRSAIISRGIGAMVYVDQGNGHYAPRAILTGRIGDEFSEVLAGLQAGEKVVTTGNVLIDSQAQLTAGE